MKQRGAKGSYVPCHAEGRGRVKQVNKIGNYTADVDKGCRFSLHCVYPVTSLSGFAYEQISIKE